MRYCVFAQAKRRVPYVAFIITRRCIGAEGVVIGIGSGSPFTHTRKIRELAVRNGQTTVTQYYSLFALMLRGERLAGGDRWINPSYLCLRSFVTSRVTRGCNYIIGESWMDSFNPLCFCLGSFVTNRVTRVPRM